MNGAVTESEIYSWIEQSINDKKLKNYEISLNGKTEKGDGYVGEIVFVSISGTTNENKKNTLHWVIKHGKKNIHLRNALPMQAAFDNEISLYSKILPTFKQFQFEKNIQNVFESVPKCYNTLIFDNMEVIVLDNLKTRGYELHDKRKPFNTAHLKVALTEYGKLHALSFAFKDQKAEEFNQFINSENDVFEKFLKSGGSIGALRRSLDKAIETLQENGELYLSEKLAKLTERNPSDILRDVLAEREPQSVIIHGDCWNNNFMFKYQNSDRTTPTNIAILDWQLLALRSPVIDLSYLIYATSSTDEFDKFDELLEVYYTSLSSFLSKLGSNPEVVFPYSALKEHWKKYSTFGFIMALFVLPMVLCDKEEAPEFENLKEGETVGDLMIFDIKDKELYFKRLKPIVKHFLKY